MTAAQSPATVIWLIRSPGLPLRPTVDGTPPPAIAVPAVVVPFLLGDQPSGYQHYALMTNRARAAGQVPFNGLSRKDRPCIYVNTVYLPMTEPMLYTGICTYAGVFLYVVYSLMEVYSETIMMTGFSSKLVFMSEIPRRHYKLVILKKKRHKFFKQPVSPGYFVSDNKSRHIIENLSQSYSTLNP